MADKLDTELSEERITAFLTDALKKVETEADPDELTTLRKLFKKCIPLGRRSYVSGYLTKLILSAESSSSGKSRRNRDRAERKERNAERAERTERTENRSSEANAEHSEKKNTEKKEKKERIQIDESLAATIFVGIGRNRRVYPRDLVGLLASVGGIERERIGTIKVLANYSFVQLFKEDAEKVIAALNGYEYRGRKLSVSYSTGVNGSSESNGSSDSTATSENSAASENTSTENIAATETTTQE